MIRDPILIDLVSQQTEAFNRNASEDEKVALLYKIQARQKELSVLNKS